MAVSLVRTSADPVTPLPSDEALLSQLRDGDTAAGETLARRHASALLRYLNRLVGSDQLAEELHQQTWLSVLEHLEKFDASSGAGGFKAWLFRIATNKANDHWRSRGRENAAKQGLRLVRDELVSDASDTPQVSEQVSRLRWAIEQLPEAQREVLLLRHYSQMRFAEIARLLGCPLNTALGRMHKAMMKLQQLLGDDR